MLRRLNEFKDIKCLTQRKCSLSKRDPDAGKEEKRSEGAEAGGERREGRGGGGGAGRRFSVGFGCCFMKDARKASHQKWQEREGWTVPEAVLSAGILCCPPGNISLWLPMPESLHQHEPSLPQILPVSLWHLQWRWVAAWFRQ